MPRPIHVEGADHILELLVGDHPSDEHEVGPPIVEPGGQCAVGAGIQVREIGDDRKDTCVPESETIELLPVVLGISQRQIAAGDVGRELPAAAEAERHEILVDADEIFRWGDVVVDEDHAAGQRVGRTGGA